MDLVSILGNISIWIILLPLFIGLGIYRNLNKESKLILLIVLLGAIPQVLRPFINNTKTLNILYNLYTPAEFLVYFFVFKQKIYSTSSKLILILIFFTFFGASFFLILEFGILNRFLNEWVIVNNIMQVLWVGICLMEYYKAENLVIEINEPFFWFLIAIASYSTSTVVFYSLWYFIKSDSGNQFQLLKIIHHIFNILLYLFFSVGLYKNLTNRQN